MEQFTNLQLGNKFTINCINEHPGVSVLWFANSLNISNDKTLTIPSLQPYHNNTKYTCVVSIQENPTGCPQNQSEEFVIKEKCNILKKIIILITEFSSLQLLM